MSYLIKFEVDNFSLSRPHNLPYLTEPSEIAEEKAILDLFIDEIVINPFPVNSAASSEAGEKRIVSLTHLGLRVHSNIWMSSPLEGA